MILVPSGEPGVGARAAGHVPSQPGGAGDAELRGERG